MASINKLLGAQIKEVFVKFWTTESCENADFVYQLHCGNHFRFPDIYVSAVQFEFCPTPEDYQNYFLDSDRLEFFRSHLFNAQIQDVLIPADPELRSPDEMLLHLSSGLYLFQESGVPIGCVPRCDLTDRPDSPLISVFETAEWKDRLQ